MPTITGINSLYIVLVIEYEKFRIYYVTDPCPTQLRVQTPGPINSPTYKDNMQT